MYRKIRKYCAESNLRRRYHRFVIVRWVNVVDNWWVMTDDKYVPVFAFLLSFHHRRIRDIGNRTIVENMIYLYSYCIYFFNKRLEKLSRLETRLSLKISNL